MRHYFVSIRARNREHICIKKVSLCAEMIELLRNRVKLNFVTHREKRCSTVNMTDLYQKYDVRYTASGSKKYMFINI